MRVLARNVIKNLRGGNDSSPAAQLQSLSVTISVIVYRKWNFGVSDVAMAFLKSNPLERRIYEVPPLFWWGVQKKSENN